MSKRQKFVNDPPAIQVRYSPEVRALAKQWAESYFEALGAEIPFDVPPGRVNLIEAVIEIEGQLDIESPKHGDGDSDNAYNAGYLLGVEIGKRMGGAR